MKTNCVRITRFGGPEVLEPGQLEVDGPGPGEVLVRHSGIGVNFVDVYHRIGQLHGDGPVPPFVPGVQANGIVEKANQALNAALGESGVQQALRKQGYEPVSGTPSDLARQIKADHEKWGKVIRQAKVSFG